MFWDENILSEIDQNWMKFLSKELSKDYFKEISYFLNNASETIFPSSTNVFNAFKHSIPKNIKVVILGQDPYHGAGQAHGLSFSVPNKIKLPPSLKNIFKELKSDLNIKREDGDLTNWAKQGVLLLNNTLTVFEAQPNSHKDIGWNTFTDNVIKYLDQEIQPVFLLWGGFAKKKTKFIKNSPVIHSPHPSPLSSYRGFFGSKPFSRINKLLIKNNKQPIKW